MAPLPPQRVFGAPARTDWRGHRTYRRLRDAVLAAEPLCRLCAGRGRTTAATEVDHIEPVHARPDLQMDRSNLRPLCHACHAAVTARQAGRIPRRQPVILDAHGWPEPE